MIAVLTRGEVRMADDSPFDVAPTTPPAGFPTSISRHEPDPASAQQLGTLLAMAAKGSAQAYEGVYSAVSRQVYSVAVRVVRDPEMAQDVAQEALVEVWRRAAEFDPAKGSPRAWILTIAHRRAVDKVRHEQSQRNRADKVAAMPEETASVDAVVDQMEREWQSDRVRNAVSSLSDKQREAIELAYYNGLTYQQVSETLDVPLGTAKTRLRDALTRLRDALEEVQP